MATELATTSSEKVHQFFEELEAHKSILTTCTNLFTTLSNHFSSLQDSLSQKSQSLDSKFQALESRSKETLESLHHRETSIPERESAAAARIEEQKEAALAELRNPAPSTVEIPATLKSLSRKMDSSALLRFIVSKRKESALLRAEIAPAIAEAVDPPRLVLDAVEEFLNSKTGTKSGVTDKRWGCGLLLQAMNLDSQVFSRKIVERAVGLVESWKEQMDKESENGAAEVVMFLQMVVCFGLRSRFDDEYLRKFVMEFATRRDMAKLAASLEFGDKMIGSCVLYRFVLFSLLNQSSIVWSWCTLAVAAAPLKTCILSEFVVSSDYGINYDNPFVFVVLAMEVGDWLHLWPDESSTSELNSIKAVIKCVEDHKLDSEFNLEKLRKRATHLEKAKAERKKSSSSGSKPQKKRAYGSGGSRGGGSSYSRPAKSAKVNAYSSSFSRRNLTTSLQPSPSARFSGPFNYPSQTMLDGSTANPYAATYGGHTQSPAGISQQHYSLSVDNLGPSSYRSSGSYAGQTSYGIYDYANAAPSTYQPPYTVDQTSYRG
ncbi:Frigida-like [Sesbania bispinosa]|nr:Frigida-like [Sesbania bispinosa]